MICGDYCAVREVRDEKIVIVQNEWISRDGPAMLFEFVPMMQQTRSSITDSVFFVTRRETAQVNDYDYCESTELNRVLSY